MQFWTEGKLKSTVHRVSFPEGDSKERFSIAYFCHPLDEVEIEPVPSPLIANSLAHNGSIKGTITAQEYLSQRLNATYNVQIDR